MVNPTIQHSRKSQANATALVTLIHLLMTADPMTKEKMVEKVGVHMGAIVKWTRLLRNKELIYIAEYVRVGNRGQWAARWTWGKKKDAEKPKPLSQAEYSRRKREKALRNKLLLLGRKDIDHEQRSTDSPRTS